MGDLGLALGNDRPRLNARQQKLASNRDSCALFDTPAFVGRCADGGVDRTRVSIDTDMRLHAKASLVTLLRCVVQGRFDGRIGQAELLLQEVDAQHGLHGNGRTAAFGACACWRQRLDQAHQLPPRNNQTHLIEKHTLARALGDKPESGGGETD